MTSSVASSSLGPSRHVRILALTVLLLAVMAQLALWWNTRTVFPRAEALGPPPERYEVGYLSLSDPQFFFRNYALQLQIGGDLGGRVTPLKDYDYELLYRWFRLLDDVEGRSVLVPTLAGYLYGNTPRTESLGPVVRFLREHARVAPAERWRWYVHAVWLASYRMQDRPLALDVANELAAAPGVPGWTRQMRAFVLDQMGDREAALAVMTEILRSDEGLTDDDRYFIFRYIQRRLLP